MRSRALIVQLLNRKIYSLYNFKERYAKALSNGPCISKSVKSNIPPCKKRSRRFTKARVYASMSTFPIPSAFLISKYKRRSRLFFPNARAISLNTSSKVFQNKGMLSPRTSFASLTTEFASQTRRAYRGRAFEVGFRKHNARNGAQPEPRLRILLFIFELAIH